MKKILFAIPLLVYILGLIYLSLPAKELPLLSEAVLSNEEGDTWQNPNQRGYYTNRTRSQVLNEVQEKTKIAILNYNLPSFRLNYRPEEAHEIVRDQLKSNYLEEIVYPLHSSVFVNGWEPKKSPGYFSKSQKVKTDLSIYGVPYEAKITLMPVNSSLWSRIFIWTIIFPTTFLVFKSLRKTLINEKA